MTKSSMDCSSVKTVRDTACRWNRAVGREPAVRPSRPERQQPSQFQHDRTICTTISRYMIKVYRNLLAQVCPGKDFAWNWPEQRTHASRSHMQSGHMCSVDINRRPATLHSSEVISALVSVVQNAVRIRWRTAHRAQTEVSSPRGSAASVTGAARSLTLMQRYVISSPQCCTKAVPFSHGSLTATEMNPTPKSLSVQQFTKALDAEARSLRSIHAFLCKTLKNLEVGSASAVCIQ